MVDWKFYIDSPQQRALDLCEGSLTEGDGWGYGWTGSATPGTMMGRGDGYGWGNGNGNGPLAHRGGDGVSSNKW
jgi:hypothetical protein